MSLFVKGGGGGCQQRESIHSQKPAWKPSHLEDLSLQSYVWNLWLHIVSGHVQTTFPASLIPVLSSGIKITSDSKPWQSLGYEDLFWRKDHSHSFTESCAYSFRAMHSEEVFQDFDLIALIALKYQLEVLQLKRGYFSSIAIPRQLNDQSSLTPSVRTDDLNWNQWINVLLHFLLYLWA